ncbi:MAG TPA: FAD-dependent oxidoreductase, partial [Longimicrobiales bacterium]|nr:FAD-dependent oxidoreductase [Longimicrobiales bacterium]
DVLAKHGVDIRTEPLLRLEGKDGVLRRVDLEGDAMELDAVFFHWGSEPSSTLAQQLGCECTARGDIRVDRRTMETSVAGVHAAGDIVGHPHLAIIAAAEGVRAALAIHRSLLPAEFQL